MRSRRMSFCHVRCWVSTSFIIKPATAIHTWNGFCRNWYPMTNARAIRINDFCCSQKEVLCNRMKEWKMFFLKQPRRSKTREAQLTPYKWSAVWWQTARSRKASRRDATLGKKHQPTATFWHFCVITYRNKQRHYPQRMSTDFASLAGTAWRKKNIEKST